MSGSGEITDGIYSFKFIYDNSDKLINIYEDWRNDGTYSDKDMWNITYNPFKMEDCYSPETSSQGESLTYYPVLNEKGFFSSMKDIMEGWDNGENSYFEGNSTIQYDNCGHLISMVHSGKGTYEEINVTGKLTWINNCLTEYKTISTGFYEGEKDNAEASYSFASNIYENPTEQIPQGLFFDSAETEFLSLLGYLGNGPKKLPMKMTINNQWVENYNLTCSYTFNSNGTIATSTLTGSGLSLMTTYSYEKAAVQTGIESVTISVDTKPEMFDAIGMKRKSLCKGLNIVRKSDGSCIKVMQK